MPGLPDIPSVLDEVKNIKTIRVNNDNLWQIMHSSREKIMNNNGKCCFHFLIVVNAIKEIVSSPFRVCNI